MFGLHKEKKINVPPLILIVVGTLFLVASLPIVPVECSGTNTHTEFVPLLLLEQSCMAGVTGMHSSGLAWIGIINPIFIATGLLMFIWIGWLFKKEKKLLFGFRHKTK